MARATFKDPELGVSWPIGFDAEGVPTETVEIPPGTEFEFEYTEFFGGRFMVDFDPGPDMRAGFYSPEEFEATFDIVEE